ncbi:VOC family protein [Chryseomicrobium sp. FSL W7-1435]|uniref:VOC family protein n=1 Tax=Chryseomicrobium sp. FSL W7-1435 TaxID=2921704 RepID=UPI00315AE00D
MNLDHIVHFVSESPKEVVEKTNYAGISSVLGGEHVQWGTANTLAFLASSYIEWLSLVNLSVAKDADHPLTKLLLFDLKNGPGFGTICLRPDSIERVYNRFQTQGIQTTEILDASRKTPNGDVLRWKMLFVKENPSEDLPLPFFIEWEQSQQEKYADLEQQKQLPPRVEELRVQELVIATKTPFQTAEKWANLLEVAQQGTQIILSNTRITFVESEQDLCRLQRVDIVGTGKENTVEIEGGIYTLLP